MKAHTQIIDLASKKAKAAIFTFTTRRQLEIRITNLGAAIVSVRFPDRYGETDEVVAGFEDLNLYLQEHPYFGVTVGRFANRIASGMFQINDQTYHLPLNNGSNHLHGGPGGFHARLWDYKLETRHDSARLELSYFSQHLEEGYPGNLRVTTSYLITDDNTVQVSWEATTDQATHVNLTNHSYFNLCGFKKTIEEHYLQLSANMYLELNPDQIPTGKFLACSNTALDFMKLTRLSDRGVPAKQELDHCFVLDKNRTDDQPAAILFDKESGRRLQIWCSQPGIQVYTSNSLDGSLKGHQGVCYTKHSAICLETQHFPNTPNQNHFPLTLLNPLDTYQQSVKYKFDVQET